MRSWQYFYMFFTRMRKRFGEQLGLTLLESLIAVSILGLIGTGLLQALDTNSRSTRILDEQVVASNLAANYFEAIKNSPYAATYPNAGDNISIPFQYSVAIVTKCSTDGTTFNDCTGNETLQRITVAVSRPDGPVLSLCTYRCEK